MARVWKELIKGRYPIYIVGFAVKDHNWQIFRESLKGKPLDDKFDMLMSWGKSHNWDHDSSVQVTNYVYALKRAGIIKADGSEE